MRQKKSISSCFVLFLAFVFVLTISPKVAAQAGKLYGIISQDPNAGYLISIDTATGDATLIGDTGLTMPCTLDYNQNTGILLASKCFGSPPQIYSIDNETGEATLQMSNPIAHSELAYRFVDNVLYAVDDAIDTTVLYKLDPGTGALIEMVGIINKGPVNGLAVRPSDGLLFGAGYANMLNENWLFTIDTASGPPPRETNVGQTDRPLTGLAFHPDGTLYATDSTDLLTLTVNPSTGTVTVTEIGPFGTDIGFVDDIAVVTPPVPGPVDVWMKDCELDVGDAPSVPTPCQVAFKSPDIWVDNDGDMIIDAPVVGAENILRAKVRNRQSGTAQHVSVKFYFRDNTTGLYFPTGATFIGEDTVTVPPNGTALASVMWNVPAPPSTGGHWCIGVLLDHPDDPLPDPPPHAREHNNIAMANIWFIAGREGEQELMSFSVGTGGRSGFGLTPWPREFIIKVDDELPTGWSWTLEGVPVGTPFTLKLGEEREAKLKVDVAQGAAPHSGGSIEVRQVDIATGQGVGGLSYNLYEDHRPPEKVRAVRASIVDAFAVLTWDEVFKESETGLRERVAYYEVLRNGKAVDKVLRDGDPYQPGIQWKDLTPIRGNVAYSVRVVDEGGNISNASNEVIVKAQGRLFNWLTLLLLILVVILLFLLLKRRGALSS